MEFLFIFCDVLFTTVPFLNKRQLPTNWDELVENSQELVTEERFNLVKTCLFPEADSGDNSSIPEPSPNFQQAGNVGTNTTPTNVPTESPARNILASSQERLPVCKGDNVTPSNNNPEAPKMINLETFGLIRSKRI